MDIITIDSIVNHGSVVQIVGHDRDGHTRNIVGDQRPMRDAIEGLGLQPGSRVGVIDTDEGPALCEPDDEPDEPPVPPMQCGGTGNCCDSDIWAPCSCTCHA